MPSEGRFVVAVLVASGVVALLLAAQAVSAKRSRDAVSNAMLRQYAELAASEFSRIARRDIESALSRTLASHVHPQRHARDEACDCEPLHEIKYWFEVGADGAVVERMGSMPAAVREEITALVPARLAGPAESDVRIHRLGRDASELVALRFEPHTQSGGTHIGLVIRLDALGSLLARTHRRAALLPAVLLDGRTSHGVIDVRVEDGRGTMLFASPGTAAGPQIASADLFPGDDLALEVRASMTPAFVSTLGPEHGAGPSLAVVMGLVSVNLLMVGVGVWQLGRERELSRLREDFVAGVSHELRTPLAQIRMFTETLLLDRIRTPAERRRALEIIGQETGRLSQLVENVLYFHRHRRAPVSPPCAVMDLGALVLEVTEQFKPLAASRRVDVVARVPAHEVLVVAGSDELRQVLLNLLDNAVKFGPAGQTVTVSLDTTATTTRIVVDDHGPGVATAERRRIFEPYERGMSRASAGAGIGLAIVKQIVTAHGGTVSVDDAPGGGARFIIQLRSAPEHDPRGVATLAG